MAISEAAKEGIYLKNLLNELTGEDMCVDLFNDNQGAISLSVNHLYDKTSKRIDMRHHFIREAVANKQIVMKYLPTNEMPADLMTHGLSHDKLVRHIRYLGLSNDQ